MALANRGVPFLLSTSHLAVLAALASGKVLAQEPATELAPIVVTATGYEQEIKNAPASITVIGQEALREKRYNNLAEALSEVEGVDVRGNTGKTGGLNISIRGLPSDYTLILIDGRRQNAAGDVTPNGFGETSTSFIPPLSAIERIEVIRGPMSTLYGSDAMGGVVNIITKKVATAWGGSVTFDKGIPQNSDFGDTSNANFYLSGPLVPEMLGLAVRGGIFNRGATDIELPAGTGSISKRGPAPVESRIYTAGAKLTLTPNKQHDFWLDVDRSRQWYNNDESQLGTLDNPSTNTYNGYSRDLRFNRDQVAVGHTSRFEFGTLQSSLMYNNTETQGRTVPNIAANSPLAAVLVPGAPRKLETTNVVFDTKLVKAIGDSHMLTVGGQYWDAEMTDGLATKRYKQATKSLFAEDEWRLREDLALTTGVRYDHHDAFGGHFSPRGYLVWNTTPNWTVKGGVSRGYRTPRLNQLHDGINGISGQGRTLTIGNPNLKPEVSTSTEVGVNYDNLAGLTANATLFHNRFKDKISAAARGIPNCDYAANPNQPGCISIGALPTQAEFGQQINLEQATTRGLELGTRVPLAPRWTLGLNYTFTDSEVKNGGVYGGKLADTPRHMANANLRWQATDKFAMWLRAELRGKSRRFDGDPSSLTGDDLRAQQAVGDLKAYSLLHLGGSYKVSKTVTLTGTVYNLLDKDFMRFKSYVNGAGDTVYLNEYIHSSQSTRGTIQPGRTFWLAANITF